MTDQERNQVLKMIESGRITPEEGLHLMEALGETPAEDEPKGSSDTKVKIHVEPEPAREPSAATQERSDFEQDPQIARVRSAVRRLWQIPLWIGVVITVLSATGMFAIQRGVGMNFWFYFMFLPLLLGVLLVVVAAGSRKARWIFVNVQQEPGEKPAHILIGFPLPLKLAAWFLRTFGKWIPDLKKTNVDEIITAVETGFTGENPLIVHVDEGEKGERVQVYIG